MVDSRELCLDRSGHHPLVLGVSVVVHPIQESLLVSGPGGGRGSG